MDAPPLDAVSLVSGGMLTVKKAQAKYGLSRDRLRALMRDGTLPFAVLDDRGTRVIPDRALAEYIAGMLQRAT